MMDIKNDPRVVELYSKKSRIDDLTRQYRDEYFKVLEEILHELKLDGVVIRRCDGIAGEIRIIRSMDYPAKFYPYKKDGTLSKNASGYINNCSIASTIKDVLDHYESKIED